LSLAEEPAANVNRYDGLREHDEIEVFHER